MVPKILQPEPQVSRLLLLDEYFASACDVVMRKVWAGWRMTRQYTYFNYMITINEWISPTIMNLFSFFSFGFKKYPQKKNAFLPLF